ncbi:hypothetical protein Lesp02_59140 [Lentzea sp. NBRC 105346]|uniref:hypothetical protein n=1 Tax=Lentzea sp. NBRC 105346 TaxID=3032205 RepID=UPI0024A1BF50|nr:hypothetical protein [Lentzea sp. NBRC 105346]GLZ33726.1 hypothetical protein Lesp02_59140 [Lentzea sp. NBRC 105346]
MRNLLTTLGVVFAFLGCVLQPMCPDEPAIAVPHVSAEHCHHSLPGHHDEIVGQSTTTAVTHQDVAEKRDLASQFQHLVHHGRTGFPCARTDSSAGRRLLLDIGVSRT